MAGAQMGSGQPSQHEVSTSIPSRAEQQSFLELRYGFFRSTGKIQCIAEIGLGERIVGIKLRIDFALWRDSGTESRGY